MHCTEPSSRLSAWLDGDLDPAEAQAVARHLEVCPSCAATLAALRRVSTRARALDDRPPTRDLWPGIAERIGATPAEAAVSRRGRPARRGGRPVPQLIAAGLAIAMVSAGTAWWWRGPPPVGRTGGMGRPADPVVAVPAAFTDEVTSRYDLAIADLMEDLAARRGRLDPETIRVVEDNLAVIDRALEQARAALRHDPESEFLRDHLDRTARQKLGLLRRVTTIASGT